MDKCAIKRIPLKRCIKKYLMKNKYLVLTKRHILIQHGGVLVTTEN